MRSDRLHLTEGDVPSQHDMLVFERRRESAEAFTILTFANSNDWPESSGLERTGRSSMPILTARRQ